MFIGNTGTLYSSFILAASLSVSGSIGWVEFNNTIYGLPMEVNSSITVFSASKYSLLGISPIEPSVVTTIPMVEWSLITFSVPISAASTNGIGSWYQYDLFLWYPFVFLKIAIKQCIIFLH